MEAAATQESADVAGRLLFLKNLQVVTNRIHATANIDEIMLEVSQDICELFNADRLTIYTLSEDKGSIISKVKTGLNSFKDLKLPISDMSVAGYVAANRKLVNITDVYDENELRKYSPKMQFLKEVDKRTGYRSKQMLVSPIIDRVKGELLGVIQIINHRVDKPFMQSQVDGAIELSNTLAIAFTNRQKPTGAVRTKYDGLITEGVISAAELEEAQRAARKKEVDLEEVLLSDYSVPLPAIGQALHKFFNLKYEPYRSDRIKPGDLLKNLKREYLEEQQWLPLEETEEGVIIVALDPEATKGSKVVNNIFPKGRIVYRVTTGREFTKTLDAYFGGLGDLGNVDDLLSGMGDDEVAGDGSGDDVSAAADNELVKLVNKIIVDAYQQGASDIHIEPRPGKEKTVIRFRKDGSLVKYIDIPASYRNALVARLKIMCDLDISEKRRPQDGKIKFKKYGPLDIELRVATIPSAGGVEDVVMRILAAGEPIPLDNLGLSKHNLAALKKCVEKPYGLFFVCGPTGSGKTTTLHSVLGYLNREETKIWTAEDPVEITQKGLRQVQVNKKAGLDFATVMKAFLRADPDIIMVGEMRDAETTGIGIEASLTGHLVFATLHTNSAPESITRLLDMGMDPFNFGDALLGILAQRLGKRLCKECKEAYTPSQEELKSLLNEYCEEFQYTETWKKDPKAAMEAVYKDWVAQFAKDGKFTFYHPKGCPTCSDTGYKGRVGLHELLVATDSIKRLIQEKARVSQLFAEGLNSAGMRTLKMDGIEKVLLGITDMKQVRSVCIK
jgi:type II secretory ATPase GspE/PulE/Tfp pilus assembly ATPase PilB-like protein